MERIALYAARLLEENGWSFREQEAHTGVPASVVYDLTLMRPVHRDWLQQFASVAGVRAHEAEAQVFWERLTRRLMAPHLPNLITPENAAGLWEPLERTAEASAAEIDRALRLFRALSQPESRHVALRFLEGLTAAEHPSPADAAPGPAPAPA